MAHFAEIDDNGIVIRVLVTDNELPNQGLDWLVENLGGTWVQTSYNTFAGEHKLGGTPLRKNYAGLGFTYNVELDAFIPPKPYESWVLNETTGLWQAPIAEPSDAKKSQHDDGKVYEWDESVVNWIEVQGE